MRQKKSRFIYMFLVGFAISFVLHLIIPFPDKGISYQLIGIGESILITILLWEGNLRLDRIIDHKLPWENHVMKRIIIQLTVSFTFGMVTLFLIMWAFNKYICSVEVAKTGKFFAVTSIIALLVSITVLTIEISCQFFRKWKHSLVELEKHKMETAQAKLENLKNQINPHFLFNNMSVLSSLVYKDQDKAVDFINQLSKVYRYLLDNKDNELVTVQEEMTFIESYCYLLNIRYSPNLHIEIRIDPELAWLYIPPLSLQLLLENAIKHNEISSDSPLRIELFTKDDYLVVRNNRTPRISAEASSNTGLKNIRARYSFFTEKTVDVFPEEHCFTVRIPLLSLS